VSEPPPAAQQQRPPSSLPNFDDNPFGTEPFDQIPFDGPPAVTFRAFEPAPYSGKIHVITEGTSKRYKGMQAGGCLMIVLAMIMFAVASTNAARSGESGTVIIAGLLLLGGLVLSLIGLVLAWWHHG
jgi:hypothetical protein